MNLEFIPLDFKNLTLFFFLNFIPFYYLRYFLYFIVFYFLFYLVNFLVFFIFMNFLISSWPFLWFFNNGFWPNLVNHLFTKFFHHNFGMNLIHSKFGSFLHHSNSNQDTIIWTFNVVPIINPWKLVLFLHLICFYSNLISCSVYIFLLNPKSFQHICQCHYWFVS